MKTFSFSKWFLIASSLSLAACGLSEGENSNNPTVTNVTDGGTGGTGGTTDGGTGGTGGASDGGTGGTSNSTPAVTCSLPSASTLRVTITGLSPQVLWTNYAPAPAESDLALVSVGSNTTGWSTNANPTFKATYAGSAAAHTLDLPSSTNRFTPWVWSSKENKAYWLDLLKVTVTGDGCKVADDGQGGKVIVR